jgi:hypothetical protein
MQGMRVKLRTARLGRTERSEALEPRGVGVMDASSERGSAGFAALSASSPPMVLPIRRELTGAPESRRLFCGRDGRDPRSSLGGFMPDARDPRPSDASHPPVLTTPAIVTTVVGLTTPEIGAMSPWAASARTQPGLLCLALSVQALSSARRACDAGRPPEAGIESACNPSPAATVRKPMGWRCRTFPIGERWNYECNSRLYSRIGK